MPVYLLTVVNPVDHPGGEFGVLTEAKAAESATLADLAVSLGTGEVRLYRNDKGVLVSVGALTHGATSLDVGLDWHA